MSSRTISDYMNSVLNKGINNNVEDLYGSESGPDSKVDKGYNYPDFGTGSGYGEDVNPDDSGQSAGTSADTNAGNSAGNQSENQASNMPRSSYTYIPFLHSVPNSFMEDIDEQFPGHQFADVSSSTPQVDNSTSTQSGPGNSGATTDVGTRNLPDESVATARSYGIDPSKPEYHTSRKRQLLEGITRAVQMWSTPQGQAAIYNGGLPAALAMLGSGGASGAIQKNALGKERLGADMQAAAIKQQLATRQAQAESQMRKEQSETQWNNYGRQAAQKAALEDKEKARQTRQQIATDSAAAKVKAAAESAKARANQVTVNYQADENGEVWIQRVTKTGEILPAEPFTVIGQDGTPHQLKKAEAITAGLSLQERVRHDKVSESIMANPPTSVTSSTSTPTPLKSKDQIASEKYGSTYAQLSNAKKSQVDDEFNKPGNLQYNRTSTTKKSRGKSIQRVPNNSVRDSISPEHPLRAPDGVILKSPEDYDKWKATHRK